MSPHSWNNWFKSSWSLVTSWQELSSSGSGGGPKAGVLSAAEEPEHCLCVSQALASTTSTTPRAPPNFYGGGNAWRLKVEKSGFRRTFFIICRRNAPGQVDEDLSLPLIKLCLMLPPRLSSAVQKRVRHSLSALPPGKSRQFNLFLIDPHYNATHLNKSVHSSTHWLQEKWGPCVT